MSVEISLPPQLQALAGDAGQVFADGDTVGGCLKDMVKKYPSMSSRLFDRQGKLLNGINIYVDRVNVYPDPLAKPVRPGDKIHIAFTVLGG